jgi:cytochrome oxidase Cu insertion factor (SCO1/SenC/PrrC family)
MNVPDTRVRGRRNFLLIAAMFLLPVAVVFGLYYGGVWSPSGTSAKGELIHPALPLEVAGLRQPDGTNAGAEVFLGKWSLIYIGDGACDKACRTALTYGRQTRIALNKDMTRVQRVLLATGNCCDQAYLGSEQQGLIALDASSPDAQKLLAQFPGDRGQSIFIVDPHGNLMMRHDAGQVINKDLLSDLKKLLKLSHIG